MDSMASLERQIRFQGCHGFPRRIYIGNLNNIGYETAFKLKISVSAKLK